MTEGLPKAGPRGGESSRSSWARLLLSPGQASARLSAVPGTGQEGLWLLWLQDGCELGVGSF